MPAKLEEFFAAGDLLDCDPLLSDAGGCCQHPAVWGYPHTADRSRVIRECVSLTALTDVPELHRFVPASRNQKLAIGRESQRHHETPMPFQSPDFRPAANIPQHYVAGLIFVIGQCLAVRRKRNAERVLERKVGG